MDPATSEIIKAWGAAGGIIVILGFVIRTLYATIRQQQAEIVALQEKRITESQGNTERFLTAINASTDSNKANTATLKSLADVIEVTTKVARK